MVEADLGTPLQSLCLSTVRRELLAGSCAPQGEPTSPSDIHEAQRCAGGIPGRTRSHAACRTSKDASPEPCKTRGSEMLRAGAFQNPEFYKAQAMRDRKSTRLNSSHGYISYAVFCL